MSEKTLGPGAYGDPENPAQSRAEFEATQETATTPPVRKPPAKVEGGDGEVDEL